jgi:hypothetical protein
MNYTPLKNQYIKLAANEQTEFDAKDGVVLVPSLDSKLYVHWVNENGKVTATYTLSYATLVQNKLKIINGSNSQASIHIIDINRQSK